MGRSLSVAVSWERLVTGPKFEPSLTTRLQAPRPLGGALPVLVGNPLVI